MTVSTELSAKVSAKVSTEAEHDPWQPWSLAMAAVSLVVMGLWLLGPAPAPGEVAGAWLPALHGLWALIGFGYLLARTSAVRGRADWITTVRVALAVVLFGLYVQDPQPTWAKLGLATLALVLDGVDGRIARRFGPTRHGAVFDMEADAFYVLTLCGIAHLHVGLGAWVLILAALRPLYVFALVILQRFLPAQTPNHEGSLRGKLIHVLNIGALLLVQAPLVPVAAKSAAAAAATVLLGYSFAADFIRSVRPRPA